MYVYTTQEFGDYHSTEARIYYHCPMNSICVHSLNILSLSLALVIAGETPSLRVLQMISCSALGRRAFDICLKYECPWAPCLASVSAIKDQETTSGRITTP